MNNNMQAQVDAGEGLTRVRQLGILLPNGVVLWSDPFNSDTVAVPEKYIGTKSTGNVFYLGSRGEYKTYAEFEKRYTQRLVDAGIYEEDAPRPQLVARDFMIIAGEPREFPVE